MPENSILPLLNDSAIIDEISLSLYQAVVDIQQQQPQLLQEKYRKIDWRNHRYQSAFCNKLKAELRESVDWNTRLRKIQKLLQIFLITAYFKTPEFEKLTKQIRVVIRRQISVESNGLGHSENTQLTQSNSLPGIAILLLDAENLQLDIETEKFLTGLCTYPIQIKVAFANWRSMGKKDAEFHTRGYELIHVPPGKDSADVKMATVGSSIFVHYPTAREVLVCSSDGVMTHLYNTLQTHGLTVYLVRKKGDNITVLNSKTNQTETHSLVAVPDVPSREEFILQIKNIIKAEKAKTKQNWFKISRISNRFHSKYKLQMTQVVAVHFPGQKVRDIFTQYPHDFALHQLPDESGSYITLFEVEAPSTVATNARGSSQETQTTDSLLENVESPETIEDVLVSIVKALTTKSNVKYVPIANVATEFQKQYGKSITKAMQDLNLGTKFPVLLQSCSAFKLKKLGSVYHVALQEDG
jgi:hypothetical protein